MFARDPARSHRSTLLRRLRSASLLATCLLLGTPDSWGQALPFLTKWGSPGSEEGQLAAWNLNVDAAGNVYVADAGNDRIQKFDAYGTFLTAWGVSGGGPGQFDSPRSVATDSAGFVYVLDSENGRVQKFDAAGAVLAEWDCKEVPIGWTHPNDIAADSSDNLYIIHPGSGKVRKYDTTGLLLAEWGGIGSGDGLFSSPNGIGTDLAGNVYVADSGHAQIQKFDGNGTFLSKWGSLGSGDGQFVFPIDVAADSAGTVYVLELLGNRVQSFDTSGSFLGKWGFQGSDCGQFSGARGIVTDGSGNVYITDSGNSRVQAFGTAPFGLAADFDQLASGDPVALRTFAGGASQPAWLLVTAVSGTPVLLLLQSATLDVNGYWPTSVPTAGYDLSGLTITFQTVSFHSLGQLVFTNPESVAFE